MSRIRALDLGRLTLQELENFPRGNELMRIKRRFLPCKNFSPILNNSLFASFEKFLKYQATKLERSNSLILDMKNNIRNLN